MKKYIILLISVCLTTVVQSQTIARFTVQAGLYTRNNTPVSVIIDGITFLSDSALYLEEVSSKKRTIVPCQVEAGFHRTLWWILSGTTKAGEKRTFELKQGSPDMEPAIKTLKDDKALIISAQNKNILQYNYLTAYPPSGVDTAYRRSGFIHPLWSPKGNVLTTIQPADHYHHYGIWNPWTKTHFEGKEIDFWNLKLKQGTVKFKGFISASSGSVFGSFKAHHEHIVYPDSTARKTALNELWDVRVYNTGNGYWLWDFTSTLSCATESPFTIVAYRYQGFGFRATPEWTKENAEYLTSEGKTRKDADGSRAKWCIVSGESAKGRSGIIFMENPSNYNSPEPIRIWDAKQNNGRGDVFFNFCPTKNANWNLLPGKEYTLKYRMLVFDNAATKEQAEAAYIDFAYPPVVIVEPNKK